ncbi:GntR family transcriptional regulator [Prauserella marina]|nr:PLP-dependent aminotransferase family protein [Prauserella marina]ASR39093.1 GntR family transcriptional regulator [Prauserella marina]
MEDFRAIADSVAEDIARGRLRAGERLPPQRRFARQRGIAGSTAARVYGELAVRGLVVGEVGRGTFVRAGRLPPAPALSEPATAAVDLELNFPVLPGNADLLAPGLRALSRPGALAVAARPATVAGTPRARAAAAGLLARAGWRPEPDRIMFAGNGRQAIAAAIGALLPRGGKLGVEPFTYPLVRGIAARFGVTLVPLDMDDDGLVPDGIRGARPHAVYLQPTLHNPLGGTMPAARRHEVATVLRDNDIPAIEDTIYAFLRAEPPLAAYAPEHTVLVDSLSKRLLPGLTVGFAVAPPRWYEAVASSLRAGAFAAQTFALEVATGWMEDGSADAVQRTKPDDAARRQRIAAERLSGFDVHADPAAYHLWWRLPPSWRAETFVAAAARRGIAVSPGAAFVAGTAQSPDAVRLALAAPPEPTLAAALDVLAGIARSVPEHELSG